MTEPVDHDRDHAFAEGARRRPRRARPHLPAQARRRRLRRRAAGHPLPAALRRRGGRRPTTCPPASILARRDLRRLVEPLAGPETADRGVAGFAAALPDVHASLVLDAEAICAGDPAAESVDEVSRPIPGFLAIAIHRIAHAIHHQGVPILPRLLAEVAHTRTGIDIHPGASIGRSLLHRPRDRRGRRRDLRHRRRGEALPGRHPRRPLGGEERRRHEAPPDASATGSSIYANATVLGGDTVVGDDSVVGGNVFLTSSVPAGSLVYQTSQYRVRRTRDGFEDADYVI